MSDLALHESTALPTLSDAPPSGTGRSSPSHGVEQTHDPVSDELKARLDRVIYSDVREHGNPPVDAEQNENLSY